MRCSGTLLALLAHLALIGCAVEIPRSADPNACGGVYDQDGDCVHDALDQCGRTPTTARPVWQSGPWSGCAAGEQRDSTPAPPTSPKLDAGAPPPPPPTLDAGAPPPPPPDIGSPPPDIGSPPPTPDSWAPPKPDTTNNGGLQLSAAEQDLVDAINAARQQNGLNALVPEAKLMCAARMAAAAGGACGHSAGGSVQDRSMQCGFSYNAAWKVNEIATGPNFKDGAECVWAWKQSSGHWWGLVHPQATTIGVARNAQGCFWAMFDCCIKGS